MPNAVSTPNQMNERIREIAAGAGVDIRLSVRLTTDGTKLYAGVTCYDETDAQDLLSVIREAKATFGPTGGELTARREHRHLSVFLPMPKPDAQRGGALLGKIFSSTERTEF